MSDYQIMQTSEERKASTFSGYIALLLMLALLGYIVYAFINGAASMGLNFLSMPIAGIVIFFLISGLYTLAPNQAVAILLFGSYQGTDRQNGLRWCWPWLSRKKISVRVNNITSDIVKVNDLRGNPVEIATNVVWRVTDTSKALFDVENYQQFVDVQIESAVRVIGARYPYDDFEKDEITLRGDADEVSEQLEI